jgi:hypothetical protein
VGSKQGGGSGEQMSDQSKQRARVFESNKKRLSASLSETDRQRQFIAEGFRRACEEFRAEVEKQCNDCNHEPEIGNILETEFSTKGGTVVRRDIATEMKIVFDSALFKICIKCENPIKLIYSITVKPCAEKSDWRYVNGCGDSVKADYIVGMGIDALLGISSHVH